MSAAVATIPNVAATLIDALIASNRGDRHAFTYNGKRYSFQDVAALMNRAGNLVKNLGVNRGESVLVLVPPSPAWVATVLGAMKARAVPLLVPSTDAEALVRCVTTTGPTAAIVHEARLSDAREALAAIDPQRVAIVGSSPDGFRSFVDELRTQPSWLAAEEVSSDEAAIGVWTGGQVKRVTHAELADKESSGVGGLASPEGALFAEMVDAFRRGDPVELS